MFSSESATTIRGIPKANLEQFKEETLALKHSENKLRANIHGHAADDGGSSRSTLFGKKVNSLHSIKSWLNTSSNDRERQCNTAGLMLAASLHCMVLPRPLVKRVVQEGGVIEDSEGNTYLKAITSPISVSLAKDLLNCSEHNPRGRLTPTKIFDVPRRDVKPNTHLVTRVCIGEYQRGVPIHMNLHTKK